MHTLHNYRPLCANGLLFRDGRLCTDCPDGRPWSALEHACYRDSRVATLPIAGRNATGVDHNRLLQRADALVVLSEFARDTFVRYGVDERRLRLIPNRVTDLTSSARPAPATQRWLAVGRLRAEKGFAELLRSWPANVPLDIAGDGPSAPFGAAGRSGGGAARRGPLPLRCVSACRTTPVWCSRGWRPSRRRPWWWWRHWRRAFRWRWSVPARTRALSSPTASP